MFLVRSVASSKEEDRRQNIAKDVVMEMRERNVGAGLDYISSFLIWRRD